MPALFLLPQDNGPTHWCASSHSDRACALLYGCDPRQGSASVIRPHPQFCGSSGPALKFGTGNVGDVLVYDSRLVHWGGANYLNNTRDVVALSFVHPWWIDYNRPLTEQGRIHSAKWRHWRPGDDHKAVISRRTQIVSNLSDFYSTLLTNKKKHSRSHEL